ncbi:4Fe-4S binding protein [bacterium]|nr:4Fe-4S binding protein [bacterium]
MPRGDGTGPRGQGPGTGRGMGRRVGNRKGGMGRGLGRGMGRGNFTPPIPKQQKQDDSVDARGKAVIDEEECIGCGACILSCPEEAIIADEKIRIDKTKCTGCGECIPTCPVNAISLIEGSQL